MLLKGYCLEPPGGYDSYYKCKYIMIFFFKSCFPDEWKKLNMILKKEGTVITWTSVYDIFIQMPTLNKKIKIQFS